MKPSVVAGILRHVYDPELGIDLVALGLVYGIDADDEHVAVRIAMTSAGCPMSDALLGSAEAALSYAFPGAAVEVMEATDPPWDPAMLDELARERMGMPPRTASGARRGPG
ncbi:MAG: metal-sulfur cluster assembly factor [Chloroflexi bacterium]|nr:metal-sulfur cluster assembly factor [Chloroflexota bacterium]